MAFSFFELSRFFARKVALYDFNREGVHLRFTSADHEIEHDGHTYVPARGIAHTAIRESMSSDRKNVVTVTVPYLLDGSAADYPVTQELGNWWRPFPPSQRVLVTIMATHVGDPDEEVVVEWRGRVIGPSYTRTQLKLQCDPSFRSGRMSGSIPRMQRGCGVALYSQGIGMCNLKPWPLLVPAVLTAVAGNDVTAAAFTTAPRELAGGMLQWIDGDDVQHTAQILSRAGDTLTLDDAGDLAVDDAVLAYTVPLWFEATLTAVSGVLLTADEFGTSAKSLAGGLIEWTRPNGLVETRTIMAHNATQIRIHYGAPDLEEGLVVRTHFGCAHNQAACEEHENEINYPGFKHLPTEDPMGRSQAW